jgi:hypothetical protein
MVAMGIQDIPDPFFVRVWWTRTLSTAAVIFGASGCVGLIGLVRDYGWGPLAVFISAATGLTLVTAQAVEMYSERVYGRRYIASRDLPRARISAQTRGEEVSHSADVEDTMKLFDRWEQAAALRPTILSPQVIASVIAASAVVTTALIAAVIALVG